MRLSILVGIIMTIVIGVLFIPPIMDSLENLEPEASFSIEEEENLTPIEGKLIRTLPYVLAAMSMLGAIAFLGYGPRPQQEGSAVSEAQIRWIGEKGNKSGLTLKWIVTSLNYKVRSGLLARIGEPLKVSSEGELKLSPKFAWIVIEKHNTYPVYLIIGITKSKREIVTYILGRDSHTSIPYYMRTPPEYTYRPIEEGLRWCMSADRYDSITQV